MYARSIVPLIVSALVNQTKEDHFGLDIDIPVLSGEEFKGPFSLVMQLAVPKPDSFFEALNDLAAV